MTSKRSERLEAIRKLKESKASKGREVGSRNKVVRFLIVCEGSRTEPLYFESLIANNRYSDVIGAEIGGEGMSTCSLVERTMEIKKDLESRRGLPFDRVWVVFDKDSFVDFNEAIELARKYKFNAGWSNESFELWYYLHFEFLDTAIGRHDYIVKLNNSIRRNPGYENFNYKKNDRNFFAILQQIGNEENAKKFARRLRNYFHDEDYKSHKPCTMVDKLVEELEHPEVLLKRNDKQS